MTIKPQTIEHKNNRTIFDFSELRSIFDWLCGEYPELDCKRWSYNTESCERFLTEHSEMKPGKAYAKYLYERFSLKISETHKAELGQKIKGTPNEQLITFKITLGCKGEAHEYYHKSSCYWGEYSMSRDYIESNGGGAVRAYIDGKLVGRVWFLPYDDTQLKDGMVLFNAYGKDDLQHIYNWGKLLSCAMKKQHCKTYLQLNHDGDFYLNSPTTEFVGTITEFQDETDITINLNEPDNLVYSDGYMTCDRCGCRMSENNSYYIDSEGIDVCESCYSDYYVVIDYGKNRGETISIDDAVYIENGRYSGYYHVDDENIVKVDEDYEYAHIDDVVFDEDRNSYHVRNENDSWFRDPVDYLIYSTDDGIKINGVWVNEKNEESYIEQDREKQAQKLTIPLPLVFEDTHVKITA